jgi:arsenate reductase-like glutaredoxin family protein
MYRRWNQCVLALSLVTVAGTIATAASKDNGSAESKTAFLRLARDANDQPVSMETAIVRYKAQNANKQDVTIDLIGAVHIGEKSYYDNLNKEFEKYDVLLYELVAPEGTRVPKGGGTGSGHPVALLQNGMKDMLELEHQLHHIDYHKDNFVHADMSPEAFSKSMEDRGESIWTMMFRMMGQQIAQQNKRASRTSEADLFMALFDKNRALSLKRVMAEQFEDLEGAMGALEGPGGSTLITERNKVALKVLAEQIAAGKKRIGIFYGAGHMPDMEKRLIKDLGASRDEERWLVAWDLRSKAKRTTDAKQPAETEKAVPAAN